jgi:outer membrane protein assembly factor BamB
MYPRMTRALTLCLLVLASACLADDANVNSLAKRVLEETGVQGGLIVHVGCGDGKLTAALSAGDRYVVHGLDRDVRNVDETRAYLRAQGKYGQATADVWTETSLPYTDNLVNLVVIEDQDAVDRSEIERVLCPSGTAYIKGRGGWSKIVKPRPSDIDEWTHFLHGPNNNAVAEDTAVGAPHHLQWAGGPQWARGHEVLATISAVVSAGGRIFYVADEGPTASVDLPADWKLVARDAFNGIVLWKLPIPQWESTHRPFRSGPTDLPRRLVAVGDTVYVTLGYGQPVVALDAATGEKRRTYQGTAGTQEIVAEHGKLFLVAADPDDEQKVDLAVRRGKPLPPLTKRLIVLDAESGDTLWTKADTETADLFAQTLAVSNHRVYMQNTRAVLCLDAKTGEQLWREKRPAAVNRPAWSTPTLVVYSDVVISADRQAPAEAADDTKPQRVKWTVSFQGGNAPPGELIAFSASDGKRLWSTKCKEGYNAPVDVLLADGLLWSGDLVRARDPGITEALDPHTGEVMRTRPNDQTFFNPGMSHHRCYRNRATENFVLLGRSGVEFLDLKTGEAEANHWIRGTCQFGVLPANGMVYVPPHTCACYLKTKLNGFNALAPKRPSLEGESAGPRLVKGPAFGVATVHGSANEADQWPTYRHNASRSGATQAIVSPKLRKAWQTEIGGKLTSVVVADGKAFVARVDDHSLHALNIADGGAIWSFTAGGAVDSPPTFHDGLVIFGSADGHVYCLRAADGELVWRFRAGPQDRRVMIDGSLESAWPVHGSVLMKDGLAYFAAGRSSFLDGGILLFALDPASGEVVHQSTVSGRDPETGKQPKEAIQGFDMPGGLPDILSSDGEFIYMRDLKFDDRLVQQTERSVHLFSPTGFLDDSWWHRTYFLYGSEFRAGWPGWHQMGNIVPAGKLLVFNDRSIYGFGRNVMPPGNAGQWNTGEYYRLFGAAKALAPVEKVAPKDQRRGKRQPVKSRVDYYWSERIAPTVRAMVLSGEILFAAGPLGDTNESLAAFQGKEGVRLLAISTADGKVQSETRLDSRPVFDGMATAEGRLFLPTVDGRLTCYVGESNGQ